MGCMMSVGVYAWGDSVMYVGMMCSCFGPRRKAPRRDFLAVLWWGSSISSYSLLLHWASGKMPHPFIYYSYTCMYVVQVWFCAHC